MAIRATMVLLVMGAAGCLGSFGGNNNNGGDDGGAGNNAVYFDPDIQQSMDKLGCSSGGCHGDAATPMHVVALAAGGNADANWAEVMPRTMNGGASLLLTKPVDASGVTHDGGKLFASDSATYKQWMAWIKAGAPLRASGSPALPPTDMGASMPAPAPVGDLGPCVAVKPTTMTSHNPGTECVGCHMKNPDPTLRFTLAGTLYMDKYGTTPRGGATVLVTDANGAMLQLVTDVYGNFYTTKSIAFPVTTSATACPSVMPMVPKSDTGACNTSGCHDAALPAYLP